MEEPSPQQAEPGWWPIAFTVTACMVAVTSCTAVSSLSNHRASVERARIEAPAKVAEFEVAAARVKADESCRAERK